MNRIDEIKRSLEATCRTAAQAAAGGIAVWRGQRDGAGTLRSVLPSTAYSNCEVASAYAEHPNDPAIDRRRPSPS